MVLIHGYGQNPLGLPFIFPASAAKRRMFANIIKIPEPNYIYVHKKTDFQFFSVYCQMGYPYNVVTVDYSATFVFLNPFAFACCGVIPVSTKVAKFVEWVQGVYPSTTQISSFSLGGPIGGLAATMLKNQGVLIRRLTGKSLNGHRV